MKDILITLGDKYSFRVIKGRADNDVISVLQNHEEILHVQAQKLGDSAPP
jgi:hypothetical protein